MHPSNHNHEASPTCLVGTCIPRVQAGLAECRKEKCRIANESDMVFACVTVVWTCRDHCHQEARKTQRGYATLNTSPNFGSRLEPVSVIAQRQTRAWRDRRTGQLPQINPRPGDYFARTPTIQYIHVPKALRGKPLQAGYCTTTLAGCS